jgi:hypothetical protein
MSCFGDRTGKFPRKGASAGFSAVAAKALLKVGDGSLCSGDGMFPFVFAHFFE